MNSARLPLFSTPTRFGNNRLAVLRSIRDFASGKGQEDAREPKRPKEAHPQFSNSRPEHSISSTSDSRNISSRKLTQNIISGSLISFVRVDNDRNIISKSPDTTARGAAINNHHTVTNPVLQEFRVRQVGTIESADTTRILKHRTKDTGANSAAAKYHQALRHPRQEAEVRKSGNIRGLRIAEGIAHASPLTKSSNGNRVIILRRKRGGRERALIRSFCRPLPKVGPKGVLPWRKVGFVGDSDIDHKRLFRGIRKPLVDLQSPEKRVDLYATLAQDQLTPRELIKGNYIRRTQFQSLIKNPEKHPILSTSPFFRNGPRVLDGDLSFDFKARSNIELDTIRHSLLLSWNGEVVRGLDPPSDKEEEQRSDDDWAKLSESVTRGPRRGRAGSRALLARIQRRTLSTFSIMSVSAPAPKDSRVSATLGAKRSMSLSNDVWDRDRKRPKIVSKKNKKQPQNHPFPWLDGSVEDVLRKEVKELLHELSPREETEDSISKPLPALYSNIQMDIIRQSASGDGLAYNEYQRRVYVVPFTMPGDTAIIRPYTHMEAESYSLTDLIQVVTPSNRRHDEKIECPYFSKCGGCQFQMMSLEDQLAQKREVVRRAYHNYAEIDPSLVPEVEPTLASPLQYGYRTKLTPHFDHPHGFSRKRLRREQVKFSEVPPIGFNSKIKGKEGRVLDIEDCPLGTEAVRFGLKKERERVKNTIDQYSRGATLLLRETTERVTEEPKDNAATVVVKKEGCWDIKTYESNPKATIKEYIGEFVLTNQANSFFQNNNSILPSFIDYISDKAISKINEGVKPSYLVDAYCGCGLFTVTLSPLFKKSIGIDIDPHSIRYASENAKLNNLSDTQATFMTATASEIFSEIKFPAGETVVVIDPPRRGCDVEFLTQLLTFGPQRIVYISCNVHAQARDVAFLINGMPNVNGGFGIGQGAYVMENLRGCDFFPQTHHVEAVAVLQRRPLLGDIVEQTLGI